MENLYCFEPLDRCFFRGSKPFNAGETQWLEPEFPPSMRVMQGAIRSAIGEWLKVDWSEFRKGNGRRHKLQDSIDLVEQIGDAGNLGRLTLAGPYLRWNSSSLLFPAPLDLYEVQRKFGLLKPSVDPMITDLGQVHLPCASERGLKVVEGKFVAGDLMAKLLAGTVSEVSPVLQSEESGKPEGNLWSLYPPEDHPEAPALADLEPIIGLARDNSTRRHVDGMLYGISFVRPRKGVTLVVRVAGVDERLHPAGKMSVPFGGEGKLASLVVDRGGDLPARPELAAKNGKIRFKVVLTTPARMPVEGWLPEGMGAVQMQDHHWHGELNGISVSIVSACLGKSVRIGGWDMASNAPRPLQSFVPAGSVYFCEADESQAERIKQLHGSHIGCDTQFGFGHVLVGNW